MQPQRDVRRLHRLLDHAHQLIAEPVQVGLITQLGGEAFKGLRRIILPTVEATIYEGLDATTKGGEQGSYHKGGDDYGELWLLLLACGSAEDPLDRGHSAEVDER